MQTHTLDQSIEVNTFSFPHRGEAVNKCAAISEEVEELVLNKGLDVGRLERVGRLPLRSMDRWMKPSSRVKRGDVGQWGHVKLFRLLSKG